MRATKKGVWPGARAGNPAKCWSFAAVNTDSVEIVCDLARPAWSGFEAHYPYLIFPPPVGM